MIGEMNLYETEKLLKTEIVGRLACHAEGITYIVPISYAYADGYIYGHSFDGMKIEMMRKNPNVCFQTDRMENMANWKSVVAWGKFEEVKAKSDRKEALEKLLERHLPILSSQTVHLTPHWPFPPEEINEIQGIVFRIKVEKMTGRFEKTVSNAVFA
jgi:nitroimidazol reductase NimA-like FMN-containing flavoprotein (pyridoxamine 5'-phosphate oxidase superfamily)